MKIEGSITALVTPMFADGAVDFDSLKKFVDFQIENGTDALVAVGTTGESPSLNIDEHLQVIDCVVQHTAGRVPVIAGTGSNCTRTSIETTRQSEKLKVDACLSVVPYYNKPTQEGLYQHFKAIAESTSLPVILYNVPGRTVANLDNQTTARLADVDNIIGIKDATGDMQLGKELLDLCGDRLTVLSGDDLTLLEFMKLGAKGAISVVSNAAPKQMHQLCKAALAGDFAAAELIDQKLAKLHRDLFVEANPIPVKYAVSKLNHIENNLRLPLTPLSKNYQSLVDEALEQAYS